MIVIPNDRLLHLVERGVGFNEGLRVAEAYLPRGVRIRIGSTCLELEETGETTELLLPEGAEFGLLLGASMAMRELFARLRQIAGRDVRMQVEIRGGRCSGIVDPIDTRSPCF